MAQPNLSRGIVITRKNTTPNYDCKQGMTFKVNLPVNGVGNVTNFVAGCIYVFIILQDMGKVDPYTWPPECAIDMELNPAPGGITVQSFIATDTNLVPNMAGTWN